MCVCIVFPQVGVVVDLVVFQVVAKVKGCILLFRPDHTGQTKGTVHIATGQLSRVHHHYKTCRTFQLIIGNYKLQLAAHSAY